MYQIEEYTIEQGDKQEHIIYKKDVPDLEAERQTLEAKHNCWQSDAFGEKKRIKNITFTYKSTH